MIQSEKLDQLTSLRFFAAMMIVVHHSHGLFGFGQNNYNLGNGVTFFFVLSGFILQYVYKEIDSWEQVRKFLSARVARIAPAYFASLLLGSFLVHYNFDTLTFLSTIFFVQAWIPISTFYYSYNSVAWSVSAEMFFYLLFPLILWKWNGASLKGLGLAGLFLALALIFVEFLDIPLRDDFTNDQYKATVTKGGMVYINPVIRVFEFILGVFIGGLFIRNRKCFRSKHPRSLK